MGRAEDFSNNHRKQVNQEKRSLVSALNASGDSSQAANLSAQSAGVLAGMPAPNPIGQLFTNFSALGAIDADAKRNGYRGLLPGSRNSNSQTIIN